MNKPRRAELTTDSRCSATRENALHEYAQVHRLSVDERGFALERNAEACRRGVIQWNLERQQLWFDLLDELLVGLDKRNNTTSSLPTGHVFVSYQI